MSGRVAVSQGQPKDDPVNDKHPLGKLIQDAMTRNEWSLRILERRAEEHGHKMSHANFGRLRDEPVLSIKAETIKTLAAVLKERESVVAQAALESMGVEHGLVDERQPLAHVVSASNEISEYDQELLEALLGVMTKRRAHGQQDTPPPTTLYPVEDADSQDAREEQKIERAAHTNLDPEIGPEDTPHEP